MAQEAGKRWLPVLLLLLAVLLAFLQVQLWSGEGGRDTVAGLEDQVAKQTQDNASREQRNAALAAEVADLKNLASGGEAVEERARSELGMIRPGEVFYRVVEEGTPAPVPPPDPDSP
ncbi:cell division protein FtsB [Lysobacter sp. SG-8]|uniref:Cell division protein FtsB n=1 Tax=Marilutibacter penaei TaxID=2759900 RepID=A0A7W3U5X6_9GAMM|nr:cell division protein FtsB [Lysobacter penaei]MBB1089554.1 cell division protein FtsB [Lysobacter penaei]